MSKGKSKGIQQGAKEVRCCICSAIIYDGGCNPAPVNNQEGARCCHQCNERLVIPKRAQAEKTDRLDAYEKEADLLKVQELESMTKNGYQGHSSKSSYCITMDKHTYKVTKEIHRIG